MKRQFVKSVLITIAGIGLFVGSASAAPYIEEYTGTQIVSENQTFKFGFDMWYPNTYVSDNSALVLTTDAAGAFGEWVDATLSVKLYSDDIAAENATFSFKALNWNGTTLADFGMGSMVGEYGDGNSGQYFTHIVTFNQSQLNAFEAYGWGNVYVTATLAFDGVANGFDIKSVKMEVNTSVVPEPTTMLLFGAGLAGLAAVGRRRKN